MKTVITQKVQSVPSPAAHGATLANQVNIAVPDVKEGSISQTSLSSDRQQRTSAFVVGLALSVGTCSLAFMPLPKPAFAIKNASASLSTVPVVSDIPSVSSDLKVRSEDIYMKQLRQDVSSMRTQYHGTDAGLVETQPVVVAQRIDSYFHNRPSYATTASNAGGIAIPVPAPSTTTSNASGIPIPVPAPRTWNIPTRIQQRTRVATGSYNTIPSSPASNSQYTEPPAGFIWPAKGALTSGYGRRWGRMHKGIDIAGPIGTPIVAAASGTVISAAYEPGGYGNKIDIQHPDGSVTRYGHNRRLWVSVGQQVRQGQQIAELGNTGRSTGPHLHFEIHVNGGGAVNPIAYLPSSRES